MWLTLKIELEAEYRTITRASYHGAVRLVMIEQDVIKMATVLL